MPRRRNFGERPPDEPPKAFVGPPRKDGKHQVQYVFPVSGRRITKIETRETIRELKDRGYSVYGYRVERRNVRRKRRNTAMGYRGSRGAKLIPAKLKRMPNGRYKVFVAPGAVARMHMNPGRTFQDVRIGDTFRFAHSRDIAGGGRFLGQDDYRKTGARTYEPADASAAIADLKRWYSGYPDTARKIGRKDIKLRVGSVRAEVE